MEEFVLRHMVRRNPGRFANTALQNATWGKCRQGRLEGASQAIRRWGRLLTLSKAADLIRVRGEGMNSWKAEGQKQKKLSIRRGRHNLET